MSLYEKVPASVNFVEREKQTEKFWHDNDIFRKSMEQRKGDKTYTVRENSSHIPLYFHTLSLHFVMNGSSPYFSI